MRNDCQCRRPRLVDGLQRRRTLFCHGPTVSRVG
jgi:hypothetical protein